MILFVALYISFFHYFKLFLLTDVDNLCPGNICISHGFHPRRLRGSKVFKRTRRDGRCPWHLCSHRGSFQDVPVPHFSCTCIYTTLRDPGFRIFKRCSDGQGFVLFSRHHGNGAFGRSQNSWQRPAQQVLQVCACSFGIVAMVCIRTPL